MIVTSIVNQAEALRELRDELAALAELPGAASSIVQHPDWLLFELDSRTGAAMPHIVVARDGEGRMVGYAPFLAIQHQVRIAFGDHHVPVYRGRTLRMLGAGVVVSPDARVAVEQAIVAAIGRDRKVRVIRIQETELPNTLADALSASGKGFTVVASNLLDQVNWTIQPQASPAAYLAAMDSKKRNDLTRRLRNVYKKLGEQARLRIFDTPESIDQYGRLMNQVYARSWHADAVAIDWEQPERRALFTRLAAKGQLVGHLLMLGERPIAYVHGYRLGGRYVLDDTGYDEEFSSLGIGSSLVFQAIQDLIERHPGEVIDFGYGDNQYKRVLANRQTPCGSLYAVRGMRESASFQLIKPLRWLYRGLRRMRQKSAGKQLRAS